MARRPTSPDPSSAARHLAAHNMSIRAAARQPARPPPSVQGLKFDLIVYSPYKCIDGFFEDIKEAAAEAGSSDEAAAAAGLDPGMAALSEQQLGKARGVAYSAADALLLSDAPLLHAPGRLALAAVRSGFNKVCGVGCGGL